MFLWDIKVEGTCFLLFSYVKINGLLSKEKKNATEIITDKK